MKQRGMANGTLSVSPVTLGTMTFGSPVAFNDAVKLVHQAQDAGINLIDTANMYEGYNRTAGSAGGAAEEIVGEALKGRRDKLLVATKLGMRVGAAPEDEGTGPAAIQKQLAASLKRLKTDYVDIYYLHKPGVEDDLPQTLQMLEDSRKKGLIRFYGVSNYSAAQLKQLVETAERLQLPPPVICQPPLSLLKQEALDELIPYCIDRGIAVTPYQVLQGGLLTGKYKRGNGAPAGSRLAEKPDWMPEMNTALFDKLDGYAQQAKTEGLTMTQYAIRWTLRQKGVATTIVGVKTQRQILDAVQAAGDE
jgi:aryl-alcohol dehydrogenase-like predicted oxidoreductase